jgi:(p)ppGpp synthase/HD superfamily hydrolase
MVSKNLDISDIYDTLALRIATKNIDDCYVVL